MIFWAVASALWLGAAPAADTSSCRAFGTGLQPVSFDANFFHTAESCLRVNPAAFRSVCDGMTDYRRGFFTEAALDAGYPDLARRFLPADPVASKLLPLVRIAQARLAAAAGRWRVADSLLAAWKNNPERQGGSGTVLFWQGWSAAMQNRRAAADSLFMLSSAYAEEASAQKALAYRFATLLDTGAAWSAYVHGLPESPWSDSARLGALQGVPVASPLHPYALWQEAEWFARAGKRPQAKAVLAELAQNTESLPGRRAAVQLAWFKESQAPDSALAAYERLLLEYQQGVPAEFARSRIKAMTPENPSP